MAVIVPTTDDFLTRFPTFEGQDDLIEQLIPEALRFVNAKWVEADTKIAIMYAVAHMIVSEGSADSLPVVSESLGPISTSYSFDPQSDPWTRTEYGRRFIALRNRSTGGGIMVL